MSDLPTVKVSECCGILDNLRIPLNAEEREKIKGNIPYCGANGIQGYISEYIFDEDLILLAEDGGNFDEYQTRPIAYRISGKSWVNNHAHVLRAKEGYDFSFVFYSLQHKNIIPFIKGGTRAKLNQAELREITIWDAPLPIQQRIGEIIETIDNQIDTTQALIDKYTAIKQGMMADLFSRGIDPETKALRPTFEEAPELYHKTPLGMLPKGWDVDTLSKLAEKITDGDHHTPERSSEGRYLLSARNIHDGYLDFSKVDYVPEYEYQRMIKRCFPEAGDIFISCSGSIGRVCEVPENFSCALVRSVALVKLDNNLVQSSYICWWLRTEKMQKAMINSALQAAQPNLFQGAIEQLDVVLCAPEEQLLISERLNVIESMMLLNKSDLKKLKVQKAGLMQDLLTGKVPVPA